MALLIAGALLATRALFSWLSGWSAAFCVLVYLLWYMDGKEYTGERRWNALRSWIVWRKVAPVCRHITNRMQLSASARRLYVLAPCDSVLAALWAVGLHGGELEGFGDRLHWVVPPLLLRVPLLRDVLMWTGAVTWRRGESVQDVLLELLQSGRSVCWCPSGYANVALGDTYANEMTQEEPDEEDLRTDVVSIPRHAPELLEFLVRERVDVVPVALHLERKRYWVPTWSWWLRIQRWTHAHLGYPLPEFQVPRLLAKRRPPRLQLQFGAVLRASEHCAGDALWKAVEEGFRAITCVEAGDAQLQFI